MKNNIFYSLRGTPYIYAKGSGYRSDYDLYYGNGSAPAWAKNAINSDPLFFNVASYDFRLQDASPAKDVGTTDVSVIVIRDYDGVARPQNSVYDIGTYEYVGSKE